MTKRSWSDADTNMLCRLNAVSVEQNELRKLVGEANKQRGNFQPGGGLYLIARHYSGNPEKAQALYFRMEALANLLQTEGYLPGWTLPPTTDGAISTQLAVFVAATQEPLIRVGNDIGFDKTSFLDRILALAEVEGLS